MNLFCQTCWWRIQCIRLHCIQMGFKLNRAKLCKSLGRQCEAEITEKETEQSVATGAIAGRDNVSIPVDEKWGRNGRPTSSSSKQSVATGAVASRDSVPIIGDRKWGRNGFRTTSFSSSGEVGLWRNLDDEKKSNEESHPLKSKLNMVLETSSDSVRSDFRTVRINTVQKLYGGFIDGAAGSRDDAKSQVHMRDCIVLWEHIDEAHFMTNGEVPKQSSTRASSLILF